MVITTKIWDAMTPEQRAKFQAAAEKAIDEYTAKFNAQEKEAIEFFKSEGKKIYTPDLNAFRSFAAEEVRREVRRRLAEGSARAHQRHPVGA